MEKEEMMYIILWKDELSYDQWKDYCSATGASRDSSFIKIYFDEKLVEHK